MCVCVYACAALKELWNGVWVIFDSGDGTLSVFHLRKAELEAQSDNMEDELLSVKIIKVGRAMTYSNNCCWQLFSERNLMVCVYERMGARWWLEARKGF